MVFPSLQRLESAQGASMWRSGPLPEGAAKPRRLRPRRQQGRPARRPASIGASEFPLGRWPSAVASMPGWTRCGWWVWVNLCCILYEYVIIYDNICTYVWAYTAKHTTSYLCYQCLRTSEEIDSWQASRNHHDIILVYIGGLNMSEYFSHLTWENDTNGQILCDGFKALTIWKAKGWLQKCLLVCFVRILTPQCNKR